MTDLLGLIAGVRETVEALSDRARLQAMLDVEAALADAEAAVGIVPAAAAAAIRQEARAEAYDPADLAADAARSGNLAIPLVNLLTARVAAANADAARFVHWGATSQDIIDTGLVLQLRAAVPHVLRELRRAQDAAADLARRHGGTVMAGRTWLQQATPVTFGLKAAGWLDALIDARRALDGSLRAACVVQFGGASGTLAALGDRGPAVLQALAARLGLAAPALPWHAHRGRLVRVACDLAIAAGTTGKIARDLALLAQTEVAEAADPPDDAGGSSTMPHKRNPVRAAVALTAAARAPGLAATMMAAMPQEHERGLGGWQAEWGALPELVIVAAAGARAAAEALSGLIVDSDRMRHNLDETGGLILAEAVAMRLAEHIGRARAHTIVEAASRRAVETHQRFADILAADPAVSTVMNRAAIDEALGPERYLGSAAAFIASALARHESDVGPTHD